MFTAAVPASAGAARCAPIAFSGRLASVTIAVSTSKLPAMNKLSAAAVLAELVLGPAHQQRGPADGDEKPERGE